MKYGRPITEGTPSTPESKPNAAIVPLWRRWWRGFTLALVIPYAPYLIWRAVEWLPSDDTLEGAVVFLLAVVLLPFAAYELAWLTVVVPWYREHMRQTQVAESKADQTTDNPDE